MQALVGFAYLNVFLFLVESSSCSTLPFIRYYPSLFPFKGTVRVISWHPRPCRYKWQCHIHNETTVENSQFFILLNFAISISYFIKQSLEWRVTKNTAYGPFLSLFNQFLQQTFDKCSEFTVLISKLGLLIQLYKGFYYATYLTFSYKPKDILFEC